MKLDNISAGWYLTKLIDFIFTSIGSYLLKISSIVFITLVFLIIKSHINTLLLKGLRSVSKIILIEHKTNFKLLYQEFLANDVNIISKPQKPDYDSYEFVIEDIDGRLIALEDYDKQTYFENSDYLRDK